MKVLKFGGTSVARADNIVGVIEIIGNKGKEEKLVVVVSALGGTTDKLLEAGELARKGDEGYEEILQQLEKRHLETVKALLPVQQQSSILSLVKKYFNDLFDLCHGIFLLNDFSLMTRDKLLGYGEIISSRMIAAALKTNGIGVEWKDARELIVSNSSFGNAAVDFTKSNGRIRDYFENSGAQVTIVPGFIAADEAGHSTTLGRGGSDYTAAIIAAASNASELEIWTDVSGMMTADPRWVPNARIIPMISYQEAMELSHFGAKVIYPPTIQPVMSKNIPVWIKNTFAPGENGTLIRNNHAEGHGDFISGISSIGNIALLSLEGSGMVGIPGFSKRLFEALASEQINVILITQSSSEHSICVGIDANNAEKAKRVVDAAFENEIAVKKVEPLVIEKELSIVALVGDHMKSHTGISGKMFGALGRNGVNIRAIAQGSSERNISAVISAPDVRKAVNVLHEEFFETSLKQVHLFVVGTGNVGSKLLAQLEQQKKWLANHLRLNMQVVGISNSRKMLLRESGIDLKKWKDDLDQGESANLSEFVSVIISKNLRNSIFVDITANEDVAGVYYKLLQKSISVVACNKVAASSGYSNYTLLKDLAREYNCQFLFETNVGAGLPVIGTLNDLLRSGDKINRMQAALSGTLNFVFNNYDGTKPFADVVRQAQKEGYTEPDPRLDLSGTDVMRKIMILAREAGEKLEMEDITCHSFLPGSCMEGNVEDFYNEMTKQEAYFKKIYEKAAAEDCKLKFVASYDNGKAEVGLQHISTQSDFYHLYGKDNVVLFYTDRYNDQPLVVKGAGAGADVTASGVFADIMRAAKI